jgi:hypothetical protein
LVPKGRTMNAFIVYTPVPIVSTKEPKCARLTCSPAA